MPFWFGSVSRRPSHTRRVFNRGGRHGSVHGLSLYCGWRLQGSAQRVSLSQHSGLYSTRPPIVVEKRSGTAVPWRRIHYSFCACSLVKIKRDLFEAAETLFLQVISLRDLRSLFGKVDNIANLLVVWRPFLAPLYAALYSTERTGAPLNCCWTRQIAARFGFELGDPAGKEVWESLTALVAVRLWKAHWQQRRVCLTVRGDSVAMLALVVNMRPCTRQLSLIDQGLVRDFADVSFVRVVAQHLPGLANTMADALSRMAQPCSCVTLSSDLTKATPMFPPARTSAYYRTVIRELPRSLRSRGAPTQEPSKLCSKAVSVLKIACKKFVHWQCR